jgi:probable HAF family extracellular repeat protein
VVGMSSTTTNQDDYDPHAFLYADGAMADLGFLGGHRARALGINNAGLVVGLSEWSNDQAFDFHAFLYARHMMVDLNDLIDPASGWRIVSAKDINDAQQILATACRLDQCTSVRLDLISAIPEPQAWAMLLAGLALVGMRRRKS